MNIAFDNLVVHQPVDDVGALPLGCAHRCHWWAITAAPPRSGNSRRMTCAAPAPSSAASPAASSSKFNCGSGTRPYRRQRDTSEPSRTYLSVNDGLGLEME